jgi:ankyrin repeat protein
LSNDGGANQQEIVKLLLDNGANPHMTDKYGKSPLELAREKGSMKSPNCCWRLARK